MEKGNPLRTGPPKIQFFINFNARILDSYDSIGISGTQAIPPVCSELNP
jgi:hypothetical protein